MVIGQQGSVVLALPLNWLLLAIYGKPLKDWRISELFRLLQKQLFYSGLYI
jgi:hypothetical protein